MAEWKKQIASLPFPQRASLTRELEEHARHFPGSEAELRQEDVEELREIHSTLLLRLLEKADPVSRGVIEFLFSGGPITACAIYVAKENFMLEFIRQGGAGMYVILVVGALLLLKEAYLFWKAIVIREHSDKNLRLDTATVAVASGGLVLLGICATALGIYFAANYASQPGVPAEVFLAGVKEALGCLIVSSSLSALVLFLHFFTRRTLLRWKVPAGMLG